MIKDILLYLTKQLYPKGRAFRMPRSGVAEAMNKGLIVGEKDAYDFTKSILDAILPDNDNFTEEDALLWEKRLFINVSSGVALEDRKAAILRKMQHPGEVLPRQNFRYIEKQLQLAGFDVYVHEYDGGGLPSEVTSGSVQHGQIQHGVIQHGQGYVNIVANHTDEILDSLFVVDNLNVAFFIGAATYPNKANIPAERKIEFRELILKLKPAQTPAYLLVNYI